MNGGWLHTSMTNVICRPEVLNQLFFFNFRRRRKRRLMNECWLPGWAKKGGIITSQIINLRLDDLKFTNLLKNCAILFEIILLIRWNFQNIGGTFFEFLHKLLKLFIIFDKQKVITYILILFVRSVLSNLRKND